MSQRSPFEAGVPPLQVLVAQTAPLKGRVTENLDQMGEILNQAGSANLVVFPETATSGYFVERGVTEVARTPRWVADQLAERAPGFRGWVITGFYEQGRDGLHNSVLLSRLGDQAAPPLVHRKCFLPTYGVFDEKRFVSPGRRLDVFPTEIGRIGLLVCEDAWHSITATVLALKGAQVIVVPSASPVRGFAGERPASVEAWRSILRAMALEHGVWVVHANLSGFEGSRGFPGGSLVISPDGTIVAEAGAEVELLRCEIDLAEVARIRTSAPLLDDLRSSLDLVRRSLEELP